MAKVVEKYRSSLGVSRLRVPDEVLDADDVDLRTWSLLVDDQCIYRVVERSARRKLHRSLSYARSVSTSEDIFEQLAAVARQAELRKGARAAPTTFLVASQGLCGLHVAGAAALTDRGVYEVAREVDSLVSLTLSRCPAITDVGLRALFAANPRLESVDLSHMPQLGGSGLAALADACHHVQVLSLSGCTGVETWLYERLARALTRLEVLRLDHTRTLQDTVLRAMAPHLHRLRVLDVSHCNYVGDSGVVAFTSCCPHVEELRMPRTRDAFRVSDTCLMTIGHELHSLRVLDIAGNHQVTDVGVSAVAQGCPDLRHLDLSLCRLITDASARLLSEHCPHLEWLSLAQCSRVSDVGIRVLARACPNLSFLRLSGLSLLNDGHARDFAHEGIQALGEAAPPLTHLDLTDCFQLGPRATRAIASGCTTLTTLRLGGCAKLDAQAVVPLLNACTGLQTLALAQCTRVDDALAAYMAKHRALTDLSLRGCDLITDQGAKALVRGRAPLRALVLAGCGPRVTDAALMALSEGPVAASLRRLDLAGCSSITSTGVGWLADKCPAMQTLNVLRCRVKQSALRSLCHSWEFVQVHRSDSFFGVRPALRAKEMRAMRDFARIQKTVARLQATFRARRAHREYVERRDHVLKSWIASKLQAIFRGIRARRSTDMLREQQAASHTAALSIQCAWRVLAAKRCVERRRRVVYARRLEAAAMMVQTHWRCLRAKRELGNMREAYRALQRHRNRMALRIQRLWRGHNARACVRALRREIANRKRVEAASALAIQCHFRRWRAQRELAGRRRALQREEELRVWACRRIQAAYRGRLGRKTLAQIVEAAHRRENAASTIQAAWRGARGRRLYATVQRQMMQQRMEDAATRLQQAWIRRKERRMFVAVRAATERESKRKHASAVAIQRVYRGVRGRRAAERQRQLKLVDLEASHQQANASCELIQRVWRGVLGRRRAVARAQALASEWSEFTDESTGAVMYMNNYTGEVRLRMPQQLLELLPRPWCNDCGRELALAECFECEEMFCEACFHSVHRGGKRRLHRFRPLLDYYGRRIDYGEGEWPCAWPSEVVQDQYSGWFPRTRDGRQLEEIGGGGWARYRRLRDGAVFYFHRASNQVAMREPAVFNTATEGGVSSRPAGPQTRAASRATRDAAPSRGDPHWTKYCDEEGSVFYHDHSTGISTYRRPPGFDTARALPPTQREDSSARKEKPRGWVRFVDEEGRTFYHHAQRGLSTFRRPPSFSSEPSTSREKDEDGEELDADRAPVGSEVPAHGATSRRVEDAGGQWSKYADEEGREYFFNEATGSAQWERPREYATPMHTARSVRVGDAGGQWSKYADEEGREYFFNEATGSAQWERPREYATPMHTARSVRVGDAGGQWSKYADEEGREYFFNEATGSAQWERPREYATPMHTARSASGELMVEDLHEEGENKAEPVHGQHMMDRARGRLLVQRLSVLQEASVESPSVGFMGQGPADAPHGDSESPLDRFSGYATE